MIKLCPEAVEEKRKKENFQFKHSCPKIVCVSIYLVGIVDKKREPLFFQKLISASFPLKRRLCCMLT